MIELIDGFIPCPRRGALLVDVHRGVAGVAVVAAREAGEG